jgi:hypothetical protein
MFENDREIQFSTSIEHVTQTTMEELGTPDLPCLQFFCVWEQHEMGLLASLSRRWTSDAEKYLCETDNTADHPTLTNFVLKDPHWGTCNSINKYITVLENKLLYNNKMKPTNPLSLYINQHSAALSRGCWYEMMEISKC